jgi:hypothetical protein
MAMHAFYAATAREFLRADPATVVGHLTRESVSTFHGSRPEQAAAWDSQILILRSALKRLPERGTWNVLLEYSLRRLRRRLDAILLGPGVIFVVEFKIGARAYDRAYQLQAEDYALCIRDFHSAADRIPIVPLVCAENAPDVPVTSPRFVDGVADTVLTNRVGFCDALIACIPEHSTRTITWKEFDQAPYNPTPSIIEAARAIYAGHTVQEIGRSDAEGEALARTAERLRFWVERAREKREHVVCFLTGTPGAGKSLLGLNLVLKDGVGRVNGEPAVVLTGNRPLVEVLTQALTDDWKQHRKSHDASRALHGSLQTLLGYLKQHSQENGSAPPEHVVVFDEAQRAWDAETGMKLLQRRQSEPALFLGILKRLRWACLVCLVGPGQEINRGEGGMALWGAALTEQAKVGHSWRVVAPSGDAVITSQRIEVDPALNLKGGLRAYRNAKYGEWVDAVLSGDLARAAVMAEAMPLPPAFITRDLPTLKAWLQERRRGGRRPGLLVSSGAVRSIAEGIPRPPMSNELKEIARWFLKRHPDFRGSDSLEVPLSEFGCQGLELDYVGLCWGGDMVWSLEASNWMPRKMKAPSWQRISKKTNRQFRVNAYRVLLTRARVGLCIFIPEGSLSDSSRDARDFDAVAEALRSAGCRPLA